MTITEGVDLAAFRSAGQAAYERLGLAEARDTVLREIGKQ